MMLNQQLLINFNISLPRNLVNDQVDPIFTNTLRKAYVGMLHMKFHKNSSIGSWQEVV